MSWEWDKDENGDSSDESDCSSCDSCSDERKANTSNMKPIVSRDRRAVSHSISAVKARQNRLKRKLYIESLENEKESLMMENKRQRSIIRKQKKEIKDLESKLAYAKAMTNNNREIKTLLNCLDRGLTTQRVNQGTDEIARLLDSNRDPFLSGSDSLNDLFWSDLAEGLNVGESSPSTENPNQLFPEPSEALYKAVRVGVLLLDGIKAESSKGPSERLIKINEEVER